jgi:23S rRNA pseudouridine1911/1915/1917 synthase
MKKNIIDYCSETFGISKRLSKKYILENKVKINGLIASKYHFVSDKDEVELNINVPDKKYLIEDFLICKNDKFVSLDKPSGMHTERHSLEDNLTIEDIVSDNFKNYRLISRLDFETDGIITAVEKNFDIKEIRKKYLAFVNGVIPNKIEISNEIDARHRKRVKVTNRMTNNITSIIPLEVFENYCLVQINLKFAARHQIRAYLSYLGYPIVGDKLYGKKENCRLMLHCAENNINNVIIKSNITENFYEEVYKLNLF